MKYSPKGSPLCAAPCSPGYSIYRASPRDSSLILSIMERAAKALKDKDLFIADGPDFAERVLSSEGFGLLAVDGQHTAAAYLLVVFPGLGEDNLGLDLGFDKARLKQVAHMDSLAVLPSHRGNHLQRSLLFCGEKAPESADRPYRMATVSPFNLPSLKSFLACGYEIKATKEKYGGYLRHILLKHSPGTGDMSC